MTISNSNSFDLFSYGSESVFWYFQFQELISDFSDNPLKLNKISCRGPQICSIRLGVKFPSSQTARQSRGNVQMSCRRSCIALLQSSKNTRPQPQLPTSLATTTKPIALSVPSIISCCCTQPKVIREVFCTYF